MFPLKPTYASYSCGVFLKYCIEVLQESQSKYKTHGCGQGQELGQNASFVAQGHFRYFIDLPPLCTLRRSEALVGSERDVSGSPLEPKVACPELPDQRA